MAKPFEARLYIQGVGVYVPHENREELLVLFPDQDRVAQKAFRGRRGKPICRHHAVVQFSARYLEDQLCPGGWPRARPRLGKFATDLWTTIDIGGFWVGFSSDTGLRPALVRDGRVPGVPHLPEILRGEKRLNGTDSSLNERAWPSQKQPLGREGAILKAGLHVHAGVLSPYAEYEGLYEFNGNETKYASVLKLELGTVERFALRFRAFEWDNAIDLPLRPAGDELEVWIRHFCELERPDPDHGSAESGEEDIDFILNYALLSRLDEVLAALGADDLPVPVVSDAWLEAGGPIGLEPHKCMGSGAGSYAFEAPLQ